MAGHVSGETKPDQQKAGEIECAAQQSGDSADFIEASYPVGQDNQNIYPR